MPMIEHFLMESPLGTLTLVNTNGILSGLYMPDHLRGPKVHSLGSKTTLGFDAVRSQLGEYFEHKRTQFDLPIMLHGRPSSNRCGTCCRRFRMGRRTFMESSRIH